MQDYSCLDTLTACCSPEREHRCFWAPHGGVSGFGTGTLHSHDTTWWRNTSYIASPCGVFRFYVPT